MSTGALKVLVIDDEPPIRKLLRMGLVTQGYEILEAPNGRAALELLSQSPDLIILDLGLPDMQGLDLLKMLRAQKVLDPQARIKVSRPKVRRILLRSILYYPWPKAWTNLAK